MSISYQLIRSDRRTLSLSINEQGALIVRAPRFVPRVVIDGFVSQKEEWIVKKRALIREQAVLRTPFRLESGAIFPWLGGGLEIRLCAVPMGIDYHGALLLPRAGDPAAHARLWMKLRAAEVLGGRVKYWAQQTGLFPVGLAFGTAKKRWGSMSTSGQCRLNLALLHCPIPLIDYVIVHELAHITHPDHSPAFHALVRTILPDADRRRAQLGPLCHLTTLLSPNDREEDL